MRAGTGESMHQPEHSPHTVIRPYREGPLLVRGDFQLQDEDGNLIDPRRGTIALCRCGRSASKPFCDGSHALAHGRRSPGPADGRD
jgi:Iron-binding zinc finger CDGSH type